ncbi:MAG: branched-chain amino acid ABC transporter permease [Burkholderiales bacterium]
MTTVLAPRVTSTRSLAIVFGLLLLFPLIAPNNYILGLGVLFLIYLILIASLNLLMGYAGQISMSHAAFFGLGAYASGILSAKFGWSPWLGLVASIGVSGLAALIVGWPSLRLRGHYLAMATLGFNAIVSVFFVELYGFTGGPEGLSNVPSLSIAGYKLSDARWFYVLAWLATLTILVIIANVLESRVGRGVRALAGSELAAASLGVDVHRYKLFVFVLTACMASVAGWLYVHFNNFCSPETFNFFASVMLVVMVALGGWGRYWGGLWGALILTAVPEVLRVFESLEILVFGVAMVIVLLFFPRGIDGALTSRRKAKAA